MSSLWRTPDELRLIEAQLAEQHWLGELLVICNRKPWVTQEEVDRALRVHEDTA